MATEPTIYLRNKDLLVEIHASKNSYSSYVDYKYSNYDAIVMDYADITPALIEQARASKENAINALLKKANGNKYDPVTVSPDDVVIRVMTYDHIPLADIPEGKKISRQKQNHVPCNFPPFQHFVLKNGEMVCVGKSHWIGGMDNGYFSTNHGRMTERLGKMQILLVTRYSTRPNWRGYSYVSEMISQALLQLAQNGLMFNEACSEQPNPFGYYTSIVTNSFRKVLHTEKKNQNIRDDLLIQQGSAPSLSRQIDNEV